MCIPPTQAIVLVLALVALAGATSIVYYPGLAGPFLLDDHINIDRLVVDEFSWAELQPRLLATGQFGGLSRSLTNLSFALTLLTSGQYAPVFKYQNLLLHLCNGLLVFWFVALLWRANGCGRVPACSGYVAALIVAAIWLLHPMQVSTVLYAVQRLVILSAFFSLSTLCLWLEGRRLMPSRPLAGHALALLGLGVFWPLALLSKENAVLVAPALLLIEVFALPPADAARRAHQTRWLLVVTGLAVALALIIAISGHNALFSGYAGRGFTLPERLMTEVHALWLYFQMILVPVPARMTLFHDGFAIQRTLDWPTTLAGLGLLGMALGALALRRRAPLVGFGILWFFCWHLVESTILPLELVFEHRNYLALLGPVLALVALTAPQITNRRTRQMAGFAVLGLLLLLGANTAARANLWRDTRIMMMTDYAQHPDSPRLIEGMFGIAVARGDAAKALFYAREQQRVQPTDAYGAIQELFLYCRSPVVPPNLLEQTRKQAAQGRVTPATVNGLRRLHEDVAAGRCPAITLSDLLTLAEALARNGGGHVPDVRVAALTNWALIAMQNGEQTTAAVALREARQLAGTMSPGAVADVEHAIGVVAAELPSVEVAAQFVAEVKGADRGAPAKDSTGAMRPRPTGAPR